MYFIPKKQDISSTTFEFLYDLIWVQVSCWPYAAHWTPSLFCPTLQFLLE